MAQLIWTEPALPDLEEIAEYIALDNYNAAQILVQKIFSTVERLVMSHQNSGRRPPEFRKTIYREVIVTPCRIFYKIDKESIYILYVMRGERALRKYILEERNKNKTV